MPWIGARHSRVGVKVPYQRLVYRSRAVGLDDRRSELSRILAVSSRNNAARGMTGALTLCGNTYIQALEGPPAEIEHLMGVLATDPRHRDIQVLGRWRASRRLFCGWAMANAPLTTACADTRLTLEVKGGGLEVAGLLFTLATGSPLTL